MIAEFDISFLTRVGSHNCYRLHENGLSHQVECCCFTNLIGESFPSLLVSADFDTPDTDGAIPAYDTLFLFGNNHSSV